MDSARSTGWKMGVIIGVISIAVHYAMALCLRQQQVVGWGLLMAGLIVITTVLYGVTGIRYANRAATAVSFKNVFRVLLVAVLISTAMSLLWSLIYMRFINPAAGADYQQSRIAVLKMMHKTPEELNAEIAAMQSHAKGSVSFISQAIFFGELILAKSVVAAITTLLMLRTPKPQS